MHPSVCYAFFHLGGCCSSGQLPLIECLIQHVSTGGPWGNPSWAWALQCHYARQLWYIAFKWHNTWFKHYHGILRDKIVDLPWVHHQKQGVPPQSLRAFCLCGHPDQSGCQSANRCWACATSGIPLDLQHEWAHQELHKILAILVIAQSDKNMVLENTNLCEISQFVAIWEGDVQHSVEMG